MSAPGTPLSGVAESLLLPLVSRALEGERPDPFVVDRRAAEIVAGLDYDPSGLHRQRLYHTIICLRVRKFDEIVARFLAENPGGTVVNLGCGLDTRFDRLDSAESSWIEIDLPEVIALRRRFLAETERRRFLAASLDDDAWLEAVAATRGPRLFVAEGVFMFLPAAGVRRIVVELTRRMPGSELAFDAVKPLEVWLRRFHPTLSQTGARLAWGLARARRLETWAPGVRLLEEWYYDDQPLTRLGAYRWLRRVPGRPLSARVLHCRLGVQKRR